MDTPLLKPQVAYTITINGQAVAIEGSATVSFKSPYNRVDINVKPMNTSLSYFEARATKEGESYDIGVGALLCHEVSISTAGINTYFNVDSTTFSKGDGVYRIGLYSKNDVDGAWDVTYLLMTCDGLQFIPIGYSGFDVLTKKEI